MKVFRWDNDKNEWLIKHRGVCFEQVVLLLDAQDVLDVLEHPNQKSYPGQKIVIVRIDNYAYLVPCIRDGNDIFLKTIIPSRKATREYLRTDK